MENLFSALPAILKASQASPEVAEMACMAGWKHAVGEGLSRHAIASALNGHTLVVEVEDRVWRLQLEEMRGQLIARLNTLLGHQVIKAIDFQINAQRFLQNEMTSGPDRSAPKPFPIELLSAAATIEDLRLRRLFLEAATSCLERVEQQS